MYSQLQELLAAGKWREANRETKIILREIAREDINLKSVSYSTVPLGKIPVQVLCDIDSLWAKYSNNHFGFSSQKRVWNKFYIDRHNRISTYHAFIKAIGWYDYSSDSCGYYNYETSSTKNVEKENPNVFSLEAPQGHLPMFTDWDINIIEYYFQRGALDGIAQDIFDFFARIPQVKE
jgi:hypothetical protein